MISRLGVIALSGLLSLGFALPAAAQATPPSGTAPPAHETPTAKPRRSPPARPAEDGATKKEPTVGQLAGRERMRKCAAEWKATKAANKVEPGMKWPKFWSQCNKRLKEQKA